MIAGRALDRPLGSKSSRLVVVVVVVLKVALRRTEAGSDVDGMASE